MPVLSREPSLFPADLLTQSHENYQSRQWWAVYTKARQEKSLARQLVDYEVPFYLPLVSRETMTRGRRLRAHVPLFCGYLFVYGNDEERVRALTTNRISRMLSVADQRQLFSDLRQVNEVIESGAPLTIESRLEPGQTVRVRFGAFAGMEGKILQRRGSVRLLIAVKYLQQGISIEIDDMMVEPV
jgi:transcriptional antiterminator RfaH